jgi:hypothetical protein
LFQIERVAITLSDFIIGFGKSRCCSFQFRVLTNLVTRDLRGETVAR